MLDRIIRLTTDPGDVVLDAFAGTGTSALVAGRLDRRFIAVEQADEYLHVADRRLREKRSSWQRGTRPARRGATSKRALQLELKRLALMLGRLPTPADVARLSKYAPATFEQAFDSWGVALKAARNVVGALPEPVESSASAEQLEMFAAARPPRVFELVEQQRPRPQESDEAVEGDTAGGETVTVTVIPNEEDPPSYLIS